MRQHFVQQGNRSQWSNANRVTPTSPKNTPTVHRSVCYCVLHSHSNYYCLLVKTGKFQPFYLADCQLYQALKLTFKHYNCCVRCWLISKRWTLIEEKKRRRYRGFCFLRWFFLKNLALPYSAFDRLSQITKLVANTATQLVGVGKEGEGSLVPSIVSN